MNEKRIKHYEKKLNEVANHSSKMERRAEDAEQEVDKMKKVEYMEEHIGDLPWNHISITSWGMYVELTNTVEV